MRINAKGLHWTAAKLADGTSKNYWYAWRGGPRLRGEPGSPEFVADYNAAAAMKVPAPEGRLLALLQVSSIALSPLASRAREPSPPHRPVPASGSKTLSAGFKSLALTMLAAA